MAAETTYEVNAKLQLQGKFEVQMRRASRSIDPVQRKMMRLTRTVQKYGRAIQGAKMQMGGLGRATALAGGAAAGGGFAAMVVSGFRFNKATEDIVQNLATMNAFNKVGNKYVKEGASETELFAANVGLAKTAWASMLKMQQETPAGAMQLGEQLQGAMAGLAQVNRPLGDQLELLTKMSMLGPALNNDYKQLGADMMRILGGGAGQDVLVYRIMRNQLFDAVKASGKLGKSIQNNDKFTQRFNTELSSTEKFAFLEKSMETLGPKFKKMFGESMSGLGGATKSKMAQISGAFTAPMYLGFRNFLKRANMNKGNDLLMGGFLEGPQLDKLIGIAAYFGNVVGKVFNRFLRSFETLMYHILRSWSAITDGFVLAFDVGIKLLQIAIVTAIGRKAAGMFVDKVGKAMALFEKGQGAVKKGGGGMKGMGALLPNLLGFGALTVAAAVVGTIVAGMAAYIIGNWKMLVDQVLAGWDMVNAGIVKVWVAAMQLWGALMIIGEAFLGATDGANMATGALGIVETVLKGLGVFVQIIAAGMIALNLVIAGFQLMIGDLMVMQGRMMQLIGLTSLGKASENMGIAFQEAGKDNLADADKWKAAMDKIDEMMSRKGTKREVAEAQKKADELKAWLKRFRKGKNTPTSGVNINNQYNQWDLRNTDPDRIMSAFVPKLEQMADQRTQSYEALDQGV